MVQDADIARERDILAKAFNIVNGLEAMAPAALFGPTVQKAEQSHVFRDMLDHVGELGISPATFVAVHALAQCADNIRYMPPSEQARQMDEFLFDTVKQSLGPEIHDHLREWVAGLQMDEEELARATTWAKLGAMSRSLELVGFIHEPLDPA